MPPTLTSPALLLAAATVMYHSYPSALKTLSGIRSSEILGRASEVVVKVIGPFHFEHCYGIAPAL